MNTKNTKRALISSVLALILCFSMLVGTTYAWFTDSVTTGVNTIQSGKLDVELIDAETEKPIVGDLAFEDKDENDLWEPGCTYTLPAVKVKNAGNLALKYSLIITGLTGDAGLNAAIEWTVTLGGKTVDLSGFQSELAPGATSDALVIQGHMKESAGNDYMDMSLSGITIAVSAYQNTVEYDSFDNMYDEAANATMVSTAADLIDAIAAGGEVALTEDIAITGKLSITKDTVIYGLGNTLSYSASDRAIDVPNTANGADLTIKDLTVELTGNYCERGINYNTNGNLTLDNVTLAGNTKASYGVNLPSSSDNAKVEIVDSDLTALIALNVWGENSVINVTNTDLTSYDKSEAEGYAAVKLNNDGSNAAEGTVINITGGSITAKDEKGDPASAVTNATVTGEVKVSDTTAVIGVINAKDGMAVVRYTDNDGNLYDQSYLCSDLQSAVNKAAESNNAIVMMIKDIDLGRSNAIQIPEGKNVVLDLNGYTLTCLDGGSEESWMAIKVNKNATLTVNDSSEEKTGEIVSSCYGVYVMEGAKLVMNGGKLDVSGNGVYDMAVVLWGGTFEMNAGAIRAHIGVIASGGVNTITIKDGCTIDAYESGDPYPEIAGIHVMKADAEATVNVPDGINVYDSWEAVAK